MQHLRHNNEKLKEITSYVDYRGRAPIKTEEGCFLVTAKNIKRGYIDYECSQEYVAVDNYTNVMSKGLPLIGDVLFTTEAPMGHVAQVDRTNIALAQRVIKFRATSLLTNDYLFHYMLSETYQCLVTKKSYGTTVQGISGKELHQTILSFPTLPEQQKIASFLTSIDKKIELLTQKEKLLKDYKKGIMQKIFSQEIRFKADDGSDFPEWVEKRLGDVSKITTGKLDANAMVDGGKYRFYTCAKDYFRINDYAFETNALIISGNGANVGYIHHYDGRFNAYQRTYVLDGFIDNIIFVKYTLDKNLSKRIRK